MKKKRDLEKEEFVMKLSKMNIQFNKSKKGFFTQRASTQLKNNPERLQQE